MIHFIVSDPACSIEKDKSVGIYPYKMLKFTRCHPSQVEKVRMGLQGLTGNHIPIFNVTDWEKQAIKLLTGK
jgi:hypothetical protein